MVRADEAYHEILGEYSGSPKDNETSDDPTTVTGNTKPQVSPSSLLQLFLHSLIQLTKETLGGQEKFEEVWRDLHSAQDELVSAGSPSCPPLQIPPSDRASDLLTEEESGVVELVNEYF